MTSLPRCWRSTLGSSFQPNNMTKDEHKNAIVTQLQQQSLNLLVDSLAAALAEIEQLKAAAADKPTA